MSVVVLVGHAVWSGDGTMVTAYPQEIPPGREETLRAETSSSFIVTAEHRDRSGARTLLVAMIYQTSSLDEDQRAELVQIAGRWLSQQATTQAVLARPGIVLRGQSFLSNPNVDPFSEEGRDILYEKMFIERQISARQ